LPSTWTRALLEQAHRPCATYVEQGIEHGGPARVGDQGGDARKIGGRWHATSLFIINSSAAELTVLDREGVSSGCLKRAI
jgi:hypothetical protein